MMYVAPAPEEPLSQGDILDACPIFGLEVPAGGVDLDAAPARWRERVIVLTQSLRKNRGPRPSNKDLRQQPPDYF